MIDFTKRNVAWEEPMQWNNPCQYLIDTLILFNDKWERKHYNYDYEIAVKQFNDNFMLQCKNNGLMLIRKFNNREKDVEIELKYDIIKLENKQAVINYQVLNQLIELWNLSNIKTTITNYISNCCFN